jgi:hypothetical protein
LVLDLGSWNVELVRDEAAKLKNCELARNSTLAGMGPRLGSASTSCRKKGHETKVVDSRHPTSAPDTYTPT